MAYCFKRRESVLKAVRRIGRERMASAFARLENWRRAAAIHGARKDLKKMRALLRLVRPGISKRDYRRLKCQLRDAAGLLAPLRDASVNIKASNDLERRFHGRLDPGALRQLRLTLSEAARGATSRFEEEKAWRAAGRKLRRVANEWERLEITGKGWKVIGPGVIEAYRQGQRACQRARREPVPGNFHTWRKRAKDLWYQVTLLRSVWPEQMDALISESAVLCELLGDDHDLVILREAVNNLHPGKTNPGAVETLAASIAERQKELRSAALELGARFYAEKPAVFCDRLAGYWRSWRGKKRSAVRTVPVVD